MARKFAPVREASPSLIDANRLRLLERAAASAYAASTLLEAQEILAAVSPGLATSISVTGLWASASGATPQTSSTETLTVPAGNPGKVYIQVSCTTEEADFSGMTVTYQINADPAVEIDITTGIGGVVIDVANGDTLTYALDGAFGSGPGDEDIAAITTRDNTTGALLGAGGCTLEINA